MKVLVCIFSHFDRTDSLAEYCFKKLKFDNILTLRNKLTFVEKFRELTNTVTNNDYDIVIRSDGDLLVFENINILVNQLTDNTLCTEGIYYDNLMLKFRGGSPHVYRRCVFEKINKNEIKLIECNKPESNIITQIKQNTKFIRTLTCLHDFEQYNSKVTRTLVNRFKRNHSGLYDFNYLKSIGYTDSINEANRLYLKYYKNNDCIYTNDDISHLDTEQQPIQESDLPILYEKYKTLYDQKLKEFK